MTPAEFGARVLAYCAALGASETSGFRTREHNADEGGKFYSPHRFALGRDVVYDEMVPEVEAVTTASRLGLRLIREADHDHLQPLDWQGG